MPPKMGRMEEPPSPTDVEDVEEVEDEDDSVEPLTPEQEERRRRILFASSAKTKINGKEKLRFDDPPFAYNVLNVKPLLTDRDDLFVMVGEGTTLGRKLIVKKLPLDESVTPLIGVKKRAIREIVVFATVSLRNPDVKRLMNSCFVVPQAAWTSSNMKWLYVAQPPASCALFAIPEKFKDTWSLGQKYKEVAPRVKRIDTELKQLQDEQKKLGKAKLRIQQQKDNEIAAKQEELDSLVKEFRYWKLKNEIKNPSKMPLEILMKLIHIPAFLDMCFRNLHAFQVIFSCLHRDLKPDNFGLLDADVEAEQPRKKFVLDKRTTIQQLIERDRHLLPNVLHWDAAEKDGKYKNKLRLYTIDGHYVENVSIRLWDGKKKKYEEQESYVPIDSIFQKITSDKDPFTKVRDLKYTFQERSQKQGLVALTISQNVKWLDFGESKVLTKGRDKTVKQNNAGTPWWRLDDADGNTNDVLSNAFVIWTMIGGKKDSAMSFVELIKPYLKGKDTRWEGADLEARRYVRMCLSYLGQQKSVTSCTLDAEMIDELADNHLEYLKKVKASKADAKAKVEQSESSDCTNDLGTNDDKKTVLRKISVAINKWQEEFVDNCTSCNVPEDMMNMVMVSFTPKVSDKEGLVGSSSWLQNSILDKYNFSPMTKFSEVGKIGEEHEGMTTGKRADGAMKFLFEGRLGRLMAELNAVHPFVPKQLYRYLGPQAIMRKAKELLAGLVEDMRSGAPSEKSDAGGAGGTQQEPFLEDADGKAAEGQGGKSGAKKRGSLGNVGAAASRADAVKTGMKEVLLQESGAASLQGGMKKFSMKRSSQEVDDPSSAPAASQSCVKKVKIQAMGGASGRKSVNFQSEQADQTRQQIAASAKKTTLEAEMDSWALSLAKDRDGQKQRIAEKTSVAECVPWMGKVQHTKYWKELFNKSQRYVSQLKPHCDWAELKGAQHVRQVQALQLFLEHVAATMGTFSPDEEMMKLTLDEILDCTVIEEQPAAGVAEKGKMKMKKA
ncbi:unnamed protein product [Amoebophrya sp. A120]|nr:unnamed protein product [Amoebophrya sp. A120]|eukprot:GSA120T00022883001.1